MIQLDENRPAATPFYGPSTELRNMAAELHEAMTKAEDILRDNNYEIGTQADHDAPDAYEAYNLFCIEHGFELRTDASGLCLYCAETGIPLVIGDEYDELETGECVLVKQAA